MQEKYSKLSFTLNYNFHTEGVRIICTNCHELVLDGDALAQGMNMLYKALDEHVRKCYPGTNEL